MYLAHNLRHPARIPLNKGGNIFECLSIWEQIVYILNAVSNGALSHRAVPFCIVYYGGHFAVAQNCIVLLLIISVKYIVFHIFSSFRIFILIFQCLTDKSINHCFLLVGQCVEYVLNCFFIIELFRGLFFAFIWLFGFAVIGMIKHNAFVVSENNAFFGSIAVRHYRVDKCSGICACKHKAYFADCAVKHVLPNLFKLVGINRQSPHISVLHKLLCLLARFSIVKFAVSVNAFVTVFQQRVAQNIVGG